MIQAVLVEDPDSDLEKQHELSPDVENAMQERAMKEARERILREAVQASVVPQTNKKATAGILVVVLLVTAVAMGVVFGRRRGQDTSPEVTSLSHLSTLQQVQERGFVRCAIFSDAYGFSAPPVVNGTLDRTKEWVGINVEQVGLCSD